jgi:selenocysteine lyase/cysteine desulfurase
MTYDVAAVRARFPALRTGTAHFDGPGGTQVPDVVARAVAEAMTTSMANRGSVTAAELRAEDLVHGTRAALADLLGADPRGIVFGRSATQLTFDMARTLAGSWGPGDEVVVTRLDHDANIRPWVLAAEAAGATVRWATFEPGTGELTADHVAEVLSDRTRLVAVPGASNLIGTRPPVAEIAALAHGVGRCWPSTASTSPRTRRSTWRAWAPTSTPARRTSSSARTAASWPPIPRCSPRSGRRSCFPRATRCRSASSWAPCPTS